MSAALRTAVYVVAILLTWSALVVIVGLAGLVGQVELLVTMALAVGVVLIAGRVLARRQASR